MNNLPYRPNVCMLLRNAKNLLLLGERHGNPGIWQFPQGGAEPELSLEENVIKELNEELGIAPQLLRIAKKLTATHRYDFATTPSYAVGKFRGQAQTFWLVDFLGNDTDLRLDLHTPEFQAWRWCSAAEVRHIAEPRRIKGYEAALREFEQETLSR